MAAMKEMFRDVIQQVMEVEMDEELGRERCQRAESEAAYTALNVRADRTFRAAYALSSIKDLNANCDGFFY